MIETFPEIVSISKDKINNYPLRAFEGQIFVVENKEQLAEAISYLKKQPILGFDTETKPSFKKGQVNSVALLQLSDSERAYLIRIRELGMLKDIAALLQSKKIMKVGVAIHDDIKCLQKVRKFKPTNFIELQDYVKEFGIENFGLKTLAPLLLGFRISKSQQLSNWENGELTPAQQVYAATDAWVSYELYMKLQTVEPFFGNEDKAVE